VKVEISQTKLEIVCPNCEEENTVKLSSEIKCKKCEKDLSTWKYGKIAKKVMCSGTAIVIGSISAYHVGKHIHSEDRYPIATEYSIVNSCVSNYSKPLRRIHIQQKKAICISVLSEIMKEFDYDDYKKDQAKFLDIFESKASKYQ